MGGDVENLVALTAGTVENADDEVVDLGAERGGAVLPEGAAALTELGAVLGQVPGLGAAGALEAASMRGDPDVVAVDLDALRRGADPNLLADESPRDRVQPLAELDVAIAVDQRLLPGDRLRDTTTRAPSSCPPSGVCASDSGCRSNARHSPSRRHSSIVDRGEPLERGRRRRTPIRLDPGPVTPPTSITQVGMNRTG